MGIVIFLGAGGFGWMGPQEVEREPEDSDEDGDLQAQKKDLEQELEAIEAKLLVRQSLMEKQKDLEQWVEAALSSFSDFRFNKNLFFKYLLREEISTRMVLSLSDDMLKALVTGFCPRLPLGSVFEAVNCLKKAQVGRNSGVKGELHG